MKRRTTHIEGSESIRVSLVNINVRMGQEDGDNGVMAVITSLVKRSPARMISIHVDIESGIAPEDFLHLFHPATPGCFPEFLLHCSLGFA